MHLVHNKTTPKVAKSLCSHCRSHGCKNTNQEPTCPVPSYPILTGSRATDACLLSSYVLEGYAQREQQHVGCGVEHFSSSQLRVRFKISSGLTPTHIPRTHTYVLCQGTSACRGVSCPLCISSRGIFRRGVSRKTKPSQTILVFFCGLGGLD